MYEVKKIDDEIVKKIETKDLFDFIEIYEVNNPKNKCVLISKYLNKCLEEVKSFKVYEDDIWVISIPKSGTTWTEEMAWLINNNLDYDTALNKKLNKRSSFLEIEGTRNFWHNNSLEKTKNKPRPRHIKSHLPAFLLPDELWTVKPKIIYITRNPKDVAVSLYHHLKNLFGFMGEKSLIFEACLQDKMVYYPFNSHVLEFWKLSKKNENILFLFYEDMKRNLELEIRKVAKFLGKQLSQEQADKLCEHLSFESMKKNLSCNWEPKVLSEEIKKHEEEKFEFIRKGEIGSYKKEMTEEEIKKFDEYMNCSELKKNDFEYKQ